MTKARDLADYTGLQADLAGLQTNITAGDTAARAGRKNLIINGAMKVAQRNTSTTDGNGYGVDRFRGNVASMDNLVVALTQNSVTDLPQFTKSLKVTTNTAESAIAANEYYRVFQQIESQDCQQFAYGTSSAKSVTISFWVKSSITGTYALSVYADSSAGTRMIGGTYAIGSANTWEKKTITLAGDTGRVMDNDNTEGFRINWIMAAGTDYTSANNTSWGAYASNKLAYGQGTNAVITTANATWEVTGVQLELGSVATDFEYRSYGEELALCQRYCQVWAEAGDALCVAGKGQGSTAIDFLWPLAVPLRASPTVSQTGSGWRAFRPTANLVQSSATPTVTRFGGTHPFLGLRSSSYPSSSFTNNYVTNIGPHGLSKFIFDSEL